MRRPPTYGVSLIVTIACAGDGEMLSELLDVLVDLGFDRLSERLRRGENTRVPADRGPVSIASKQLRSSGRTMNTPTAGKSAPPSGSRGIANGQKRRYRRCSNPACVRFGWDVIELACRSCSNPTASPG